MVIVNITLHEKDRIYVEISETFVRNLILDNLKLGCYGQASSAVFPFLSGKSFGVLKWELLSIPKCFCNKFHGTIFQFIVVIKWHDEVTEELIMIKEL